MARRTSLLWRFIRVMFLLALVLGVAGAVIGWLVADHYRSRARAFNLELLREMESASMILDRNGTIIGRLFIQNREPIQLKDVSFDLVQAVIAAEDNRFYKHNGVDYVGMIRAALANYSAGRIRQGASTLTMQLARNTFSLTERSYERKLVEAFLAMEVEKAYTKQEILELYLNRVYFGSGFYGVEAAARGYFAKGAEDLTLSECATLAGLLKSPNRLSPWSNRKACIEQRNFVLGRMLEEGYIDRTRYNDAMAEDLDVKNRKPILTESYIVDAIRQQVIRELNLEDAPSQGYRIYTTIESELQEVAEKSLEEELRRVEVLPEYGHVTRDEWRQQAARKDGNEAPKYLQGAVLVLDNKTGGILAMVGGRSFNESPFNRALYSKRPAGTAFLPIVYAAAFEKGFYPGTVVQDAPIDNRQVMIGGTTGVLGEWGPERDDNRYEGAIPARRALVQSKNAATVRLGMQTGLQEVAAMAKKSGITSALRPFPATFLGSSEVTLAEMTLAFSSFAGKGWRPDQPFLISKIEDRDGKVLFQQKPGRRQVMRESVAWEVHSALADSLETGTADLAFSKYRLRKLPLGGKTGTAYNFTDVWFLGYDSEITCGVWAGLDRPEPIYRGAFSNKVALPIWVRIMNASFAKYSPEPIHPPPTLREIRVCSKSGQLAIPACEELDNAPNGSGKVVRTSYVEYADSHQIPDRNCTVHGEAEFIPAQLPPGEWPRAQPAVDVTAIDPVEIKAPTVVGTDPYHSVTPQSFAEASSQAASTSHDGPRVMRAEPVRPFDHSIDKPAITLEPPPPLKF